MIDAQVQVEINPKFKRKPADKQRNDTQEDLPSSTFDKTDHGGEDDSGGLDEPIHLENFDDNDNLCDDNQVEFELKPADKRASLRCRDVKKKYIQNSSDSDEYHDAGNFGADDDDAEEFNPEEQSKSKRQVQRKIPAKRSSLGRRTNGRKNEQRKSSYDSENEDEEQTHNCGEEDDNDTDYNPEEPVNETLTYRVQIRNLLREYEPHLSQTSPFQRNLVRSIIRFQFHCQNLQKKNGLENINIYQRHLVHLSYNVETQLINLKDIPIKIICQAEDEVGDNGLLCTKCNFNVPESPKMETLMFDHVLSEHLNAYHCPHCSSKKITSFVNFRLHVWRCEKKRDVFKVTCDICGATLCDKRALQNHKWRVHMCEQEKKEALETGLVKGYAIKSTKGLEKTIQCEQCGKSFASKAYLQKHEITHQDRESREQFICPKCGKSFLKMGYEYHLKFSVTCGEDSIDGREETCEKCGKCFKNRYLLRKHVREMHAKGDLKPFVCEICGKAFRKKGGLKSHENTHLGEKPWICGKCGTAFSIKFSLRRHESTCAK